MIQHFGPKTMSWVLNLFNNCVGTYRIPNGWRKTKVVALLKPGKDPKVPKSYRPISLLCILYKLYERMIMARMSLTVEENLTPDQTEFRPGRSTSCHAKKVDAELNNACCIVTGQLKPTPLTLLYRTAGIAPPDIRRQTHGSTEKHKQETDLRHPLFDHSYPRVRLKTRKSFRTVESVQPDQAASHRLELRNTWDNTTNEAIQPPEEQLPSGRELQRKDWVTLNRTRAKVGKTASTLHKWKLSPNS
ncbi:RNA-directed DNA polymerase from mobile element jockey-like [Elysia marginata]|uniref:RNA-directed DNA polymerase from mobile element jockey-like n=1 Tax=Elysia marginata TaxID=1093978 RepID=A0AAV4GFY0_9GAST|nr:RNA-directed DNA polymerase from mobile element jockey-like [Elysia marginata]